MLFYNFNFFFADYDRSLKKQCHVFTSMMELNDKTNKLSIQIEKFKQQNQIYQKKIDKISMREWLC